ncbi:MAG: AraC family transcriptional regulator, partial [Sphingobacteriaceae bacterium]
MKVLKFTIPIPGDNNIIIRRDVDAYFYPHLHRHDEVQLTWIQKGEGTLVVDNNMHPFAPNQIFLIGANQPHVFKSDPVYFAAKSLRRIQALTIHFNPRGKMHTLFELEEMEPLRAFLHKLDKGFAVPETHVPDVSQKMQLVARNTGVDQLIAFIDMLRKFRNTPHLKELSSVSCLNTVSEHDGIRLSHIYNYIMMNYAKQVTLEDVAKEAHMSPQAFCRYFKKRTLNTF